MGGGRIWEQKNITTLKSMPTHLFVELVKFIAHRCIFKRLHGSFIDAQMCKFCPVWWILNNWSHAEVTMQTKPAEYLHSNTFELILFPSSPHAWTRACISDSTQISTIPFPYAIFNKCATGSLCYKCLKAWWIVNETTYYLQITAIAIKLYQ